ncbi:MAG: hypothetical protein HC855_13095 [Rhizobiales bacterium]|nr:hypothetical protein [Hyphomicrobiales bacterium]
MRILPRLKGLATNLPSEARIIPLDGPRKGAVLATYQNPGEVLRVPSGAYRIESRFVDGNAVASADVKVKPGLLSAVEFDHIAGIAKLQLATIASAPVAWQVKDLDGANVAAFEGIEATLALRPGSYVASVNIAGRSSPNNSSSPQARQASFPSATDRSYDLTAARTSGATFVPSNSIARITSLCGIAPMAI